MRSWVVSTRSLEAAALRIDLRVKRRGKVIDHPVVAFEHAFELLPEGAVGMQPRHFVLVLVGKELGVVPRHRFRELRGACFLLLHLPHAIYEGHVLLSERRVLVAGEELDPALDELVEVA